MNLHQVLTGAVNPGDHCFSVGSIGDQRFTAYASGCDIVILGSDFERLQIIPGAKHGNIQVGCVDCSMQQGKIAASYGNVISIFEPVNLPKQKKNLELYSQWQKSGQFFLESIAHNITWDPTGSRLLTGSSYLQLWSNTNLEKPTEDENLNKTDLNFGDWKCIWHCKTASQVHLMKFSPDGEFFATAGKDDCLLKVWYNVENWRTAVTSPDGSSEKQSQGEIDFSFVYLAHPRAVNGFSWRKTSKYMPRASVCNVLLTCCKDNVCRLWVETFLPNDCLLYGGDCSHWTESINLTNNFKRNASSKERVQNALEVNLRHFRRGRRRSLALVAHTGYLPHQQDPHHVHRNTPLHANALCHFHIAASINPATDIPLLPSITSLSLNENEEKTGPFVVHWLNNKELHFTLSMEVFLQQLRKSFEQPSSEASVEDSNQADVKSDEETDDGVDDLKINPEKKELGCDKMVPNSSFTSLSSAAIDHQIEVLLSEWSKNADMLFSIHPMDGSLLVWHVDWLDEYQPGMFRQVQVSFVSRIPVAFPTGDANSLCKSIMMYACTKNVDLAIQQGKQKPSGLTCSTSMLISSGHNKSSNSLKLSIFTPNVMMISKHADGSLNQWLVSFAEESAFSTVLSISHKSRYCGHRFHLNDLACHSVLPLLLTTSHHNALRTPDVDNPKQPFDALNIEECSLTQQNKSTVDVAFQDPSAVYSELILWRVDPVGPLSFSGGVSELARINSLHVSAFSNVAWLPTLIPSYCLGAYCNSPSACFVASDGQYLRLYEAVIDAKKLLSELSNPEISKYVGEVFNIVSQQSTARPGCIIALDPITKLHGRKTQLLHVFQEDFILNNLEKKKSLGKDSILSNAGSSPNGFSEKFYLIVIECTQDNRSLLHMWNLHLKSIPVSLDEKVDTKLSEAAWQPEEHYSSSPEKILSPFSQKYQACRANLQSTSRLTLFSEMVYSQELHLPEGVEIISIKPSAGHLSSSSIYPACSAPYLLATSCSDEKVRFWRCRVTDGESATSKNGKIDLAYIWEEWPLLIEDGLQSNSSITVPGRPVEVSCAHTNRLAVAYKQPASNSRSSQDFVMHVSIFECESTGGSCWVLEQTIHLDELSTVLDSGISVDSNLVAYNKQDMYLSSKENITSNTKHLVHLDWMSREDGSHILTVGIGSKLFMYGPLAGKVQDQTGKETLVFPLWESTKVVPLSKFVLLRSVDLVSSVDGSPPFPVSLSWVRDGILVVGMDCEMHVYSQWQPSSKQEPVITDSYSGSTPSITSLIKQSNSSSGLHPPKKTLTRSMTSLAQKICGKKTAFDPSVDMEDSGLFEAAHVLSPTLPQYHPLQLLELMDLGKVRRAKAILSHLVKCIAGEVVALNEAESNHERRLRSLTISASGSTTRDPQAFNKAENTDYTEIDSVPPLPLYALLAADDDSCYSSLEKSSNESTLSKSNQLSKESYDELFQTQLLMTDTHMLETDEENTKPRVIDLSQYSPTYFGPEHAQVLSGHLLHSSLPGLSRMEQMSLMALADTIATTSTDIGESRDRSQGLSTSHFAWAFHSVAEEELLNMLPAMQKDDPTWSELRAMGVGWWVRNTRILRKCIEKVCLEKLNDIQLALVIARLYESEFDTSAAYKSILRKKVLGIDSPVSELCSLNINMHHDPFLRSMAYWILEDYSGALETLIKQPIRENDEGSSEKQSNSTLSFDWSQPSVVFQDDSLELKWDSDNDEENEDVPISMKELKPLQRKTDKKLDDISSNYTESFSTLDENDLLNPSEDIIAVQLKFRACLKILTVELRTLSTGYEIDGGKLRYQLYHWLEKEVIALQRTCDFCSDAEELQSAFGRNEDEFGLNEDAEDLPHQTKVKQLRENFQEKRQWLLKYQSLLRMFLSYCILHGSHGGGLASVRMELILLLQESQQVYVMHTLAASLSACIYQCLCGSHNYRGGAYRGRQASLSCGGLHSVGASWLLCLPKQAWAMAGAPPVALLQPCSLISDCCASNQRDSVGVEPSEPGVGYSLVVRRFLSRSEKRNIRVGVTRFSRSKHHLALSVKRLWQYLVKQEEIQETFIKNIFTKKRCLNEIEADLGYPGGKARIIHKESDIITAFAVNKANRNCIAIASSHDVQELDVSGILATQVYTWVDDDIEVETKGSEDFLVIHARDDLTAVQGTTPYTHSNPGTPINMPWLGSTQTGRGASVMIKKAINNVRRMTSHPTLPYYLTGAQDGSVRMFEWGHSQQITCFRSGGNSRVTRMRFNYQGNKFGIVDADGYLSLYQTNWKCCPVTGSMPKPYLTWQCHNKTANDFVFVSSSSLIATAGLSTDNRNVCLWDTLVAPANSLVHAFTCHDSGATVLAYAPKHQLLISGGRKGFTYVFDLCQRQQRQLFQSHDSPVKAVAVDPTEEYFVTGSAEGNIKIWSLSTFGLLHTFVSEHARQSIFRNIGTGVMQIETGPANHIFSCGADGTMKMRILPDQFSPLNEVLKNDVKFML
ncbi:DMXL1 isoform 6 [Pan troglodytes]|uniref:DmX-like protein 1 n=1 Tax=Pan troglodytes TaxID=9598 RepID=A0A2J8LK29_PANTR|nr:DMXL1 isoform 6 [Pan troglodytes]